MPARSNHQRLRAIQRGFTLVELVIVLMVMGILLAAAAPKYVDSLNRFRVEAAARRIAADLDFVRSRAIMKGPSEEEWVRFFPANDEYEMVDDPDFDRPADEYWVRFDETAYPVDLVSAQFTNTDGYTSTQTVKFNLYGQCVCGNEPNIFPITSGQIVVSAGNHTRTVVIDPVTGKSTVQ